MKNYAKVIDPHDPLYGETVRIIAEQLNFNNVGDAFLCQKGRDTQTIYTRNQLAFYARRHNTSQMEVPI